MTWRITRYPPTPGPHSLGEALLTFNAEGVATTDDEATALKAQEFPQTFTVVDEAAPVETPPEAPPEAPPPVEPDADVPEADADDEHSPSARKRSHTRRSEE